MAASAIIKKSVVFLLIFSILFSNFSFVFAQEEKIPGGRFKRELAEIKDTVEKLDEKIKELNNDLVQCSCAKARSVCYGTRPFSGLFSFFFPQKVQKEKEKRVYCVALEENVQITKGTVKSQVQSSIQLTTNVISKLKDLQEKISKIPGTDKIQGQIQQTISSLKNYQQFLENISSQIESIEERTIGQVISQIEGIVNDLEAKLENLKQQIINLPENIKNQILNELEAAYHSILDEINSILAVFDAFKSFGNFLTALFGCRKIGVTGWVVHRNFEDKIQKDKTEIKALIHRMEFQKKLVQKEMEWGFEWERIKDVKGFSDKINSLIKKMDEINEKAKEAEQKLCSIRDCIEVCNLGLYFQLPHLCFGQVGEQKPVRVIVKLGIRMPDEWKLGKLGVKAELEWPKIRIGDLKISGLKIHFHPKISTTTLSVGSGGDLSFSIPISTPRALGLNFVCPPEPGTPDYYLHALGEIKSSRLSSKQLCFWGIGFDYLTLKCQELFGNLESQMKNPDPEIEKCYSPTSVHKTIIEKCNKILKEKCEGKYWGSLSCEKECKESLPEICNLAYDIAGVARCRECDCDIFGCTCKKVNYLPFNEENEKQKRVVLSPSQKQKIQKISQNCDQKSKERDWCDLLDELKAISPQESQKMRPKLEQIISQVQIECRVLSLIKGTYPLEEEFEEASTTQWISDKGIQQGPSITVDSTIKVNYPSRILGCGPKVTIPKLQFPFIEIPDLRLGTIALPPFLYVHLPEIITEDIDFRPERKLIKKSDIIKDFGYDTAYELCDINRCLSTIERIFSEFKISSIYFKLPDISLPEIRFTPRGDLKIPWIKISLGDIKFPTISFPGFALDFGKFIKLSLKFPSINIPLPQFTFKIKIDIDIKGLLLNLLAKVIGKFFSLPSGCIGVGLKLPFPLVIDFGTFYIWFPIWHKIKNFLGYIMCHLTGYCYLVAKKLQVIADYKKYLENQVQEYFNKISGDLEKEVSGYLKEKLQTQVEQKVQEFQKDFEKHVNEYAKRVEDKVEIPPFEKDYGDVGWDDLSLRQVLCQKGKCLPEVIDTQQLIKKEPPQVEFEYDLPTINLSRYRYEKEFPINFGTLQSLSFKLETPVVKCDPGSATGRASSPAPSITDLKERVKDLIQDLISQLKE